MADWRLSVVDDPHSVHSQNIPMREQMERYHRQLGRYHLATLQPSLKDLCEWVERLWTEPRVQIGRTWVRDADAGMGWVNVRQYLSRDVEAMEAEMAAMIEGGVLDGDG
jgi:hypothetical protein